MEARYHYLAAGDLDDAVQVTGWVCSQLHIWGAWSWEEQLCLEMLQLVPDRSYGAATLIRQLSKVAHARGDYEQALKWGRQALAIAEELGDRASMARSYHQLGVLAKAQGSYQRALEWYRQALAIFEELGDRVGMAGSYGELGNVAAEQNDYKRALGWYRQSLAISEDLGDRAGVAVTTSQIGALLTVHGNPQDGLAWTLRSLRIRMELRSLSQSTDLHWLQRQQALLGPRRFQQLLREELSDQDSQTVMEWLQQSPETG
jgi:tetratricopeptide (TPR) repeat protein